MGNKLINVNIKNLREVLTPVLEQRQEIVGAYLFGSALETCRQNSDIDLGLLLAPEKECSEKEAETILEDILIKLPDFDHHPFDLVILNHASAIFAYKVISQGQLVYAKDLEAITDFMEIVSRKRAENYPRYRQALEEIVKG